MNYTKSCPPGKGRLTKISHQEGGWGYRISFAFDLIILLVKLVYYSFFITFFYFRLWECSILGFPRLKWRSTTSRPRHISSGTASTNDKAECRLCSLNDRICRLPMAQLDLPACGMGQLISVNSSTEQSDQY